MGGCGGAPRYAHSMDELGVAPWNASRGIRYKLQATSYKLQDTSIQDTRYKIQDTRYKIQDILGASRIRRPVQGRRCPGDGALIKGCAQWRTAQRGMRRGGEGGEGREKEGGGRRRRRRGRSRETGARRIRKKRTDRRTRHPPSLSVFALSALCTNLALCDLACIEPRAQMTNGQWTMD